MVNAVKQYIHCHWCFAHVPTIQEWFRRIKNIEEMEKLIHISQDRMTMFTTTWFNWLEFKTSTEYRAYL